MANQSKKTSRGTQNDERRNKKAFKSGVKHKSANLDEFALVTLGKGPFTKFMNASKAENVKSREHTEHLAPAFKRKRDWKSEQAVLLGELNSKAKFNG